MITIMNWQFLHLKKNKLQNNNKKTNYTEFPPLPKQ